MREKERQMLNAQHRVFGSVTGPPKDVSPQNCIHMTGTVFEDGGISGSAMVVPVTTVLPPKFES